MDVQNPYGYKTILFSDFVEFVQYLGPIHSVNTNEEHNLPMGHLTSDNMLSRQVSLQSTLWACMTMWYESAAETR